MDRPTEPEMSSTEPWPGARAIEESRSGRVVPDFSGALPAHVDVSCGQDVTNRVKRRLPFTSNRQNFTASRTCRVMRRLAVPVITASVLSCTPRQPAQQAFTPPPPTPPPLRAPVCARPAEADAINVSVLVSQLQVITMTCHTSDQYNAIVRHLRPTLATNQRNLKSFFTRAYGRRAQTQLDSYITTLANLQSEHALQSGNQFCRFSSGMLDDVKPLSTTEQLSSFVQRTPIQQALAVTGCGETSTSSVKPR